VYAQFHRAAGTDKHNLFTRTGVAVLLGALLIV
jgi:hypothetical protein